MFLRLYALFLVSILSSSISYAKTNSQYIDLSKFTDPKADIHNDIGYIQFVPQYEEIPDPKKQITVEIFYGEIDDTVESKLRLEHIKNILADDKRSDPNFKTDIIAISKRSDSLEHSREFQDFIKYTGTIDSKISYEQLPSFLDYNAKLPSHIKKNRLPSSNSVFSKIKNATQYVESKMGRKSWSLVRLSAAGLGSYAGLYFSEGLSQMVSMSVAVWPGLVSGGIAYYSNAFGSFLTNGKWSNWLVETDNFFTRKLKKSLGLTHKNLAESIRQNEPYFKKKYPEFRKQNPRLFDKAVEKISEKRVKRMITSKLSHFEEYLKWWVTEVGFVAIAIQTPQAIAGIGGATSFMSMTGDVLLGSTLGVIAQGPGDIAIQVRKYQMIEELKNDVESGKVKYDNKKVLLNEIDKVLAKTGPNASYIIKDTSHEALVKIENWARKRATQLSFFAVMGVAAEIAGIPLARPILIGVGVWGALYYSHVRGWLKAKKLLPAVRNYVQRFKDGEVKGPLQFLQNRYCSSPFLPKRINFVGN